MRKSELYLVSVRDMRVVDSTTLSTYNFPPPYAKKHSQKITALVHAHYSFQSLVDGNRISGSDQLGVAACEDLRARLEDLQVQARYEAIA